MKPEDVIHTFWYGHANMCGCGDPAEVLELVRTELSRLDTVPGIGHREPAPDTREHRLLAFMLDAWGLTEHGTSLAWPWLTDAGEQLLAAMQSVDLPSAFDDGGMVDWPPETVVPQR